ncbi:MAG TPA: DUF2062 domain-containing protein [Blastocatellia bacterium]|jgi:uncharacterized protein (DUF2062 family)|nr:DUF2062 domain-containing protein [Blastocatellia bacterium]HAF22392.1 DUF2062 domain-containing protein [Blastocatellia bacterium]HCX30933.1 DUF2062 domain-containing protein [Blastocatellia bacterium]
MFRSTFRRLLALDDPPERTALAFAIGVFIAFSPFLGLHTILATLIAFLFRLNKLAVYSGTFINNPFLTLVPIIIVSYAIGAFLLGRPLRIPAEGLELLKNPHLLTRDYYQQLFRDSWYIVWPFMVGGMTLSVVCSLIAYPVTSSLLRAQRRRKRD